MTPETPRRHILTVAVEDYYQVGSFNRTVQRGQWLRFESRVERNTLRVLDLLDANNAQATFFTLGWIAEEFPELIREIVNRGHEVASKGFWHRSIRRLTPGEFRDDLLKSREAIEKASGQKVLGYRVADAWFRPKDLWALEVLAQEGFAYDSSICPMFDEWAIEPWRGVLHPHKTQHGEIWEVPLSSANFLGWSFPIAGGNYYRQFPHRLMKSAFRGWSKKRSDPFVMYFQVWELDADQPRIAVSSLLTRLRHYRNLGKMKWVLEDYFKEARFQSIASHLHLESTPVPMVAASPGVAPHPSSSERERVRVRNGVGLAASRAGSAGGPIPVTLVVPCYNEELVLPYLSNTLEQVEATFADQYELNYVFVDDRSRDGTLAALERIFGGHPRCTVLPHSMNLGVAQAILTGIRAAKTEIVCSIDCDCTYDPHQIGKMLPLFTDGVDLVTASPYHPSGRVVNVPEWRLVLSRTLSAMYGRVLSTKLATYTSCFRVYRRSVMIDLPLRESGFLGIAEMIGVLDFQGRKIVECPAVLEVRMLGRSKMKLVRTILGHLKLLSRFATLRLRTPRGTSDVQSHRFEATGRPHSGSVPVAESALPKGKVKVHG